MKFLGIDTSTKNLIIVIFRDEDILYERNIEVGQGLSEVLLSEISLSLKSANIGIDELKGFAVGIGPGSFTGMRIGLSAVKAFCLALSKPVVGIPSLDILADNIQFLSSKSKLICPIIDARRNLLYTCLYEKRNRGLKRKSRYLLISIEELIKRINKKTLFLGDGLALYKNELKRILGIKSEFAHLSLWYPKAVNLAKLGWEKIKKREFTDPRRLLPLYLYPKECQIRK